MKFLIVFPVINCLEYTKAAIESVESKHQHGVLVVDNGSNDGTREWMLEQTNIGKTNRQVVQYIDNGENLGLTIAWNQGVKRAKELGCEFVLLANNDVILHPLAIDNLIDALEKNLEWGMATAVNNRGWCDVNGGPQAIKNMAIPENPTNSEHPDFSMFMLRISAYDAVGPFDEEFSKRGKAYYEDNDYHHRMNLLNIPARCIDNAPYYHYGSITANTSNVRSVINQQYYIEKWGGLPGHETR